MNEKGKSKSTELIAGALLNQLSQAREQRYKRRDFAFRICWLPPTEKPKFGTQKGKLDTIIIPKDQVFSPDVCIPKQFFACSRSSFHEKGPRVAGWVKNLRLDDSFQKLPHTQRPLCTWHWTNQSKSQPEQVENMRHGQVSSTAHLSSHTIYPLAIIKEIVLLKENDR